MMADMSCVILARIELHELNVVIDLVLHLVYGEYGEPFFLLEGVWQRPEKILYFVLIEIVKYVTSKPIDKGRTRTIRDE